MDRILTDSFAPYIAGAWQLLLVATILFVTALLLRLAWKNREVQTGVSWVYAASAVLGFVAAVLTFFHFNIDVWKGLAGLGLSAAFLFGNAPKKRRSRRYRY